jgi:hypothetical protein
MSCLHARITTTFLRGSLRRLTVLLLFVLALSASTAIAQVNVKGQWTTLPYLMPINPVHEALMYNGKILVVSGSGNDPSNTNLRAAVWDWQAGTITVQTVNWDMFCNGMVVLPDGRPFVVGGTLQYDPFFGEPKSTVFDPATNTFTDMQNMAHGRWYPSVTTLGDGRVLTFSGSDDVTGATNTTVEIFTLGTGWSTPYNASWTPALYPRMYLLPNGKVFYAGPSVTTRLFDTTTHTWTTVGNTIFGNSRTYGSTVLLPLTPANNYDPQVISMGGGNDNLTTETIDLGAATPIWKQGPPMSQERIEMNAVMLPTGKVLAVGGSQMDEQASGASLNADLYDPATNSFTTMAPNAYARMYHSNALLLPDATVAFAGGNPVRGTYEQHLEIYQPPYLFNANGSAATRPSISSLPSAITWGGSFSVSTPDAANISSVVLIRPGAPTHAFDMDQRLVGMSFTKGSGTLTVTAPPNGNIAPPGYYLLFLVNSSGVPSVAKFTKLSGSSGGNPAPTVTSITPNSGTTAGGTTVSITGTGFLAGATVNIGGNTATGVTVVNNTSITATTPAHVAGAVNVIVTNTDSQSGTLTNGYTYTASGGGGGGISFVQVGSATPQSSTAAVILSYPFTQTAGNMNLVVVGWSDNVASLNSLTDSRGNTYVQAGTTINGTGIRQAIYYAKNIAGGSNTVTASFSQAAAYVDLRVLEYSGLDTTNPFDVATGASGTSASPSSGAATTTSATEMIFGAGTTGSSFKAAGTGFVSRIITNPDGDIAEDKLVTSTGSNSATATLTTSSTWVMQMATFRASGQTQPPPNPAPKVTSIAPNTGTANGGTAVTITGTGFLAGATVTLGGTSATGVTVVSSTSITATTPAHAAGAVTISVTNTDAQSGSLTNGYTYTAVNPAPTVTSSTPNTGTTAGGTAITIKGTGFLTGATVSLGGTAATGVTVVSSTSITTITPAHAAGAVTISVTNTDAQNGSLTNGFTYTAANPAPTVTAVNPNTGTTTGGTAITITGTGFLSGATVSLGGTAATGVTVVSSTSITATTAAHAAGAVSVSVTNTDAQSGSLTNGFTYTTTGGGGSIAFVQVKSTTPQTPTASVAVTYPLAQTAGNLNIVVAGWSDATSTLTSLTDTRGNTYVQAGTTVTGTNIRQAIYYAKNIAGGSNTVTAVFNQAAAYPDVRVLEYSGLDTTSPLDVTSNAFGTSATANSGSATTTSPTELIFGAGNTANAFGAAGSGFTSRIITQDGDIAEDKQVNSTGSYSATGAIGSSAAWVMQMATFRASGQTQPPPNPAPTVTSITPNTGTSTGGTAVTITGTGFLSGATVSIGGTAATGVTVVSSTSITATVPAHGAGAVNVSVTNTDNQTGTLTNGYTYTAANPAPTVTAVNPNTGATTGATAITITGTGFLSGATVRLGGTAATGVTVVSSTSITATTAAHAAGAVSVSVTNTDAQSGSLTNGYTYTAANPAPTVTAVNPNTGTTAGGTVITITGTGFLSGATVSLGGTAATGVTVVSSTSITATTAAHAAGALSVSVTNTDAQSGTLTNGYTYTTSGGGGVIAFVQVKSGTPQTPSASVAVALSAAQTAGNLNIVVVGWNDTTANLTSLTDTLGNTYVQAGTTISGTALRQAIYYAKNIAAGTNTVTAVFSQAANYPDVRVLEYSGLDTTSPLDVTAGAFGTSITANSGAATTTSAKELIFGAGTTGNGFGNPGTGFTTRTITQDGDIAEDKQVTSTGSNSASGLFSSSSTWVMQMATFKTAQ